MPRHEFNRQTYAEMIVRAIERKGVSGCKVTQRGDIVMCKGEEGYKVSGSAYKVAKNMAYHHGTMLLGSDLDELRRALKVDGRLMVKDKGVDSIRANHIANVPFPGEDNMAKFSNFVETVREEFTDMHGKHRFVELAEEDVQVIPEIQRGMDQLSVRRPGKADPQSWDWKFGQTPEFTEKLPIHDDVFNYFVY
jgi:lipoate-protein ligase A